MVSFILDSFILSDPREHRGSLVLEITHSRCPLGSMVTQVSPTQCGGNWYTRHEYQKLEITGGFFGYGYHNFLSCLYHQVIRVLLDQPESFLLEPHWYPQFRGGIFLLALFYSFPPSHLCDIFLLLNSDSHIMPPVLFFILFFSSGDISFLSSTFKYMHIILYLTFIGICSVTVFRSPGLTQY